MMNGDIEREREAYKKKLFPQTNMILFFIDINYIIEKCEFQNFIMKKWREESVT